MKIIIKFNKFRKFIGSVIIDKKRLKLAIIDNKGFLKPGYYHLERAVGYHFLEDKPVALTSSKGSVLSKVKYRYLAPIFAFIEKMLPPFYVKIDGSNNSSASQCMLSREGDIKIFDYTNKKVFVFPLDDRKLLKLVRNKECLSLYLPVVKMTAVDSESYYIEDFASGKIFSKINQKEQLKVFVYLLNRYVNNSKLISIDYKSSDFLFCKVMKLDFDIYLKILFEKNKNEIINILEDKCFVFSHCDLYGNNIIVDNGKVLIIDIEKAENKPIFFDLIHLVVTEYYEGNKNLFNDAKPLLSEAFKIDPLILFVTYFFIVISDLNKEIEKNTVSFDLYKLNSIKEIIECF